MKYEKKYISRHNPGGDSITSAQWLAEIMCERKAQADSNKELPNKFWSNAYQDKEFYKKWVPYLQRQVQTIYQLMNKSSEEQVLQALMSNRKIYSVLPKWSREYILNFKVKPKQVIKEEDRPKIYKNPKFDTNRTSKKNLLDRLEDL